MPPTLRHTGRVSEDGKLLFRNLDLWRENVRRLAGEAVEVIIRRPRKPVSLDQHGYYRSALLPLAAEVWGWADPDELHAELKRKHLPGIVPESEWPCRRFGREGERVEPPSCAHLSMEQMSRFIDAVIRHMQEDGIVVPSPRTEAAA